ncbi:hypothetical protein GW935_04490 [Candidatus Falkowbacteria bacterium]|nr:hypothetical protein [Candidatus Falkowbacteria bacterium]
MENFQPFDIVKQFIFRLGVLALAGIWLYRIIKKKQVVPIGKILVVWLAVVGYLLLSLTWSLFPGLSWLGNYFRQQGVFSLLFYWLFGLLVFWSITDIKQINKWLGVVVITGAFAAGYGLIQHVGLDPMPWNGDTSRIFSTFGQVNFFAHWLAMAIPLTVYWLLIPINKPWQRIAGAVVLVAELLTLLYTNSRGGWIGCAFSALVASAIYVYFNRRYLSYYLGLLLFGCVFVIVTIWQLPQLKQINYGFMNSYVHRALSIVEIKSLPNMVRFNYWNNAKDEFVNTGWNRRLFGYGKDSQEMVYRKYYRPEWAIFEEINSYPDRAHNVVIDTWLEFGLIGLLLFGGLPLYIIWSAIKRTRKADWEIKWLVIALGASVAGYFGAGFVGFQMVGVYVYYFFVLGLLTWLAWSEAPRQQVFINSPKNFRALILIGGTLMILLIAYGFVWRFYFADYKLMKAEKGLANNNLQQALDGAEDMLAIMPEHVYFKEKYLFYYANALPMIGSEEARKQAERNIIDEVASLSEKDVRMFSVGNGVARAYSMLGYYNDKKYYNDAEMAYENILTSASYFTSPRLDYGRMEMWRKDYNKARQVFQTGIDLLPLQDPRLETGHKASVMKTAFEFENLICSAYVYEKKYAEALPHCFKADEHLPDQSQNLKDIADIYYQLKNIEKTIEYNRRGYILYPDDPTWAFSLATLYKEKGDKKTALRYAEWVKKLDSTYKDLDKLMKELGR